MIDLGSAGHSEWLDLSDYVVHFPGGSGRNGSELLEGILKDRLIRRGDKPLGSARNLRKVRGSQRFVCLSEIPLGYLRRMADRRGPYGLGFKKSLAEKLGGAPVWYTPFGGATHKAVGELIRTAMTRGINPEEPLWQITGFIDAPGSGPEAPYQYDFRWEREWRVPVDIHFGGDDLHFLLLPETKHQALESQLPKDSAPHRCPLIDPTWSLSRLHQTLSRLPGARVASAP